MSKEMNITKLNKKSSRNLAHNHVEDLKNRTWLFDDIDELGDSFMNFEKKTICDGKSLNINNLENGDKATEILNTQSSSETSSGNIYRLEPVLRPKFKGKKEKLTESQRNIHIVMDNTKKKAKRIKPVVPIIKVVRPKGIPVSFLVNQQNQGAIRPQESSTANQSAQSRRAVWSLNFINDNNTEQAVNVPSTSQAPSKFGQSTLVYGHRIPAYNQPQQMYGLPPLTHGPHSSKFAQEIPTYEQIHPEQSVYNPPTPIQVYIDNTITVPKNQYSPTDIYEDIKEDIDNLSESESFNLFEKKQKRISAFERLGPQTKSKQPKLTINLCLNDNQSTRKVVDETKYIPVYERDEIMTSTDPTVVKFRYLWPWKSTIMLKRTVTARSSKTVMMLEKEQVDEEYNNDNLFMIVSVKGFPPTWTKENVMDALLENLKDKSFIPCFIEFTVNECKFLVNRCRPALLALHSLGFSIRKGDVDLVVAISITVLNTKQLEYIPRLIVRNRLSICYDGDKKADLKEFTLKDDISNFIYFPLNRISNQIELMELLCGLDWNNLQEIDLSHNRLTTIEGFQALIKLTKLQHLKLSHNLLDNVMDVLPLRGLLLRSLWLEGNPLCLNYVDGDYYTKVVKTIFPCLKTLDDVAIHLQGEMPMAKQNYCFKDAIPVVEKFLETFFRLLDHSPEERDVIKNLYHKNAILTVTSRKKLRYDQRYKEIRRMFLRSRCIEEGNFDCVLGPEKIGKLILKWPHLQHDPQSFSIDVLMHHELSTLLRVSGILKIRAESLIDEEHFVAFTRTVLLVSDDNLEYKISNEMLYWDEPSKENAENAFRVAMVQNKTISYKLDAPLEDECKKTLINIFMKLTNLNENQSLRCLEEKHWDFKVALEYFMKLLKLDNIEYIKS